MLMLSLMRSLMRSLILLLLCVPIKLLTRKHVNLFRCRDRYGKTKNMPPRCWGVYPTLVSVELLLADTHIHTSCASVCMRAFFSLLFLFLFLFYLHWVTLSLALFFRRADRRASGLGAGAGRLDVPQGGRQGDKPRPSRTTAVEAVRPSQAVVDYGTNEDKSKIYTNNSTK